MARLSFRAARQWPRRLPAAHDAALGRQGNSDDGQTGQLEAFLCVLPNEAPWLDAFVNELRAFPGRHDDQADALSQFLEFAMIRRASLHKERDPVTGRVLKIKRAERVDRR